jgi:NADH:ubiquinone oxidoreductase subunit F (NADH-binding)
VTRLELKLISVHLEIVLFLTQDRCTACAECNIGLEIILEHLMELLGDVDHMESHFSPFGDSVSVGAR